MKLYIWAARWPNIAETVYHTERLKATALRRRSRAPIHGITNGPLVTVDLPEPGTTKRKGRK
jgi:hypothetical protein